MTGAEIIGVAPSGAGRTIPLTFTAKDGSPLTAASARVVAPRTVLVLRTEEALTEGSIDGFDVVLGSATAEF